MGRTVDGRLFYAELFCITVKRESSAGDTWNLQRTALTTESRMRDTSNEGKRKSDEIRRGPPACMRKAFLRTYKYDPLGILGPGPAPVWAREHTAYVVS